jgi:hypothetical protein
MALGSVLLQMLQTLLRLWGVDTAAPLARRNVSADGFARATVRPIYSRNCTRVSISPRSVRNSE